MKESMGKMESMGSGPIEESMGSGPIEKRAAFLLEESMGSGPIEKRAAFLLALKVVANIHGDLRKLASDAHLNRESMYRMLAEKGNSRIDTLNAVLHVLGLRLSIVPEEKNSASAA